MTLIGIDSETLRFQSGLQNPPMVCLSTCRWGEEPELYPTPGAYEVLRSLLRSGDTLIGHNINYDILVSIAWHDLAADWIAALDANRVLDTYAIERIGEISGLTPRKDLSLANLYQAHGLGTLPKGEVRTSYGPLLNRPLNEYSPEQAHYAKEDARAPLKVYERQYERWIAKGLVNIPDVCDLARKRTWLEMIRAYGLRTNPDRIEDLRAAAIEHIARLRADAQELGIVREDGTRNMKVLRAIVTEAYDGDPPLTEEPKRPKDAPPRKKPWTPNVSTARAVLEESGDPRLEAFAEYGEWSSIDNMVIPSFERGTVEPIHTKWGIADTTRVTSSKPNVQNVRRAVGVRECFIPRPGYCYVSIDHSGLENVTLAQVIVSELGRRRLANFLNDGGDLHCLVGAQIFGCTYEQALEYHDLEEPAFEEARGCAKVVDFGCPGGMGARTLKFFAKQAYHLDLTEERCRQLITHWKRAVPDGAAYREWVSRHPHKGKRYEIRIPGTTIMRRGITYNSACNSGFQALGAVVESAVGWAMLKERLLGRGVLSKCAMVNFVHDEFIWEVPIGLQTEAAERLEDLMRNAPRRLLPDVKINADAKAMAHWSKKAKRIVKDGELQIWGAAA